jgi:hypothetical protein
LPDEPPDFLLDLLLMEWWLMENKIIVAVNKDYNHPIPANYFFVSFRATTNSVLF